LLNQTNIARVPAYLAYVVLPWSEEVMPLKYSQPPGNPRFWHMLSMFRNRTGSKSAEWVWQTIYQKDKYPNGNIFSLFAIPWFEPEQEPLENPGLPLAKWFRGEGLVGFRSGWGKDDLAGVFLRASGQNRGA